MQRNSNLKLLWQQYRFARKMFWRNPSAAFFSFLFPLLFLTMFGAIFNSKQEVLNVILPGIAGMSVISATFSSFAYQITFQREQGILKRMRSTPLPLSVYIGGFTLSSIVTTVIQLTLIILAGKTFYNIGWPQDWLELILFVSVGVACFTVLGIAMANLIPNFDSAPAYVNAVFLPTLFISGVFFDVDNVPKFLQVIAQLLPLKHLIEGLSGAMVDGTGIGDHLTALLAIGIWLIVGLTYAIKGFRWEASRDS